MVFLATIPIIQILVVLVIAGVVLWLVESYIPMAAPFKVVIRVVVILLLCLWLLSLFGLLGTGINV